MPSLYFDQVPHLRTTFKRPRPERPLRTEVRSRNSRSVSLPPKASSSWSTPCPPVPSSQGHRHAKIHPRRSSIVPTNSPPCHPPLRSLQTRSQRRAPSPSSCLSQRATLPRALSEQLLVEAVKAPEPMGSEHRNPNRRLARPSRRSRPCDDKTQRLLLQDEVVSRSERQRA